MIKQAEPLEVELPRELSKEARLSMRQTLLEEWDVDTYLNNPRNLLRSAIQGAKDCILQEDPSIELVVGVVRYNADGDYSHKRVELFASGTMRQMLRVGGHKAPDHGWEYQFGGIRPADPGFIDDAYLHGKAAIAHDVLTQRYSRRLMDKQNGVDQAAVEESGVANYSVLFPELEQGLYGPTSRFSPSSDIYVDYPEHFKRRFLYTTEDKSEEVCVNFVDELSFHPAS